MHRTLVGRSAPSNGRWGGGALWMLCFRVLLGWLLCFPMKMIMSPVQEAAAGGLAERAGSRGMAVLPTGKVKDHEKMAVIEASSRFYLGTVSSSAEVASLSKRDGWLFIYLFGTVLFF